jgi:UDP-N-acetylglucosamine 1-carboxyvinyltransferase
VTDGERFIVEGGRALRGQVRISGNKNFADYAMAATLLSADDCILENVPGIEDVSHMTALLRRLGAEVEELSPDRLRINAAKVDSLEAPSELVVNLRASFLVMGTLLTRFGKAACCPPGGDVIGQRPLDVHFAGFKALGAEVYRRGDQFVAEADPSAALRGGRLRGARIVLDYPSVMGTLNVLLAATMAKGVTTIINAAMEPEVVALSEMLNRMGAKIHGAGGHTIEVEGVPELHGTTQRILPDRVEAGTYALAVAATRGEAEILEAIPEHLDALIWKLHEAGARVRAVEGGLVVTGMDVYRSVTAQAVPYPGLATDLHPPFAAFLTQAKGVSVIHERVYDNRMLYISELRKMGADVVTAGQTAIVSGPTHLYGTPVRCMDVRAGAALVVAALCAEGATEINDIYHLDRGYEALADKLRSLGASIERV